MHATFGLCRFEHIKFASFAANPCLMLFDEVSFHESQIFEVREDVFNQVIEFVLDFRIASNPDKFEKRLLRFKNAFVYIKKETPSQGYPRIIEIILKYAGKHHPKESQATIIKSPYRIEMTTSAGLRSVEFSEAELIPLPE